MTARFRAEGIAATRILDDGAMEITLTDASGVAQSVVLTPDLVPVMARVLDDARCAGAGAPQRAAAPTKLPKTFAVGAARYESVVLVRFEDDTPYGLSPKDAIELGAALLEQSETIGQRPGRQLQ